MDMASATLSAGLSSAQSAPQWQASRRWKRPVGVCKAGLGLLGIATLERM